MRPSRLWLLLLAPLALAACEAVLGLGGESSAPSGPDASADAADGSARPTPDACPKATCSLEATAPWTLVAFDGTGAASCASGLSKASVVEITTYGSCSCGPCSVTSNPDCQSGTLTTTWNGPDGGTSCVAAGGDYPANDGACVAGSFSPVQYFATTALPPNGGACMSKALTTDPIVQAGTVCTPTACPSDACESSLTSGFEACLYQPGDHSCPDGLTKHSVGTRATTTCGACSCSVGATGCTGSFAIYGSSTGCTGAPLLTLPADGSCNAVTGATVGNLYSYQYTASATGVTCDAGTSSAVGSLDDQATLCCP